jgi:NADH-quinone oxidoreductase subunit G/NADP-reducing hydrogenase subunit HndD
MNLKINNHSLVGRPGQTILAVARANSLKIPSLCYHPDLEVKANCRVCLVEIAGREKLVTACSTLAAEGMVVFTDSPRVRAARAINLELILAEHTKKCADCISLPNCELLRLARVYKIKTDRLKNRKSDRATYRFANAVEIDGSQCIDCQNCVEACARQGINYLKMAGSGARQKVEPVRDGAAACVYCGQCALHCPASSAQEQASWSAVERDLQDPEKIVIAQFAPSLRVSLGEAFGRPPGENCEERLVTALKKLGFSFVTDVNFGADITTLTEAEELLARLADKAAVWPMLTSCCPAWVADVEHYHPELIPNLTTARSPQIHLAGALKTYWARQQGYDPKKIVVVSLMPCTAKKYEAARPELKLDGRPLVDYVLTTRELAYLIKKKGLDFNNLPPSSHGELFNSGSGAAAIYGASGGVMESALRTAVVLAQPRTKNKLAQQRLEFKEVRGLAGCKEATVNLGRKKLRVAVVNGLSHLPQILPKLKKYHYIEVMACPGGCIGGGGQPLPTTQEIVAKRLAGLYQIDQSRTIRRAHENLAMRTYYDWVRERHLGAKVLHTKFQPNTKANLTVANKSKHSLFNL